MAGRIGEAFTFVVPAIVVCLAVTLVFCVPAYFLLRRYWRVGFAECVASGAVAAVILNIALLVGSKLAFSGGGYSAADSGGPTYVNGELTAHGLAVLFQGILYQVVLGASIGACFWAMAFWRSSSPLSAEQAGARGA